MAAVNNETTTTSQRAGGSTPRLVAGGVLILIGALWLLERAGAVDLNATTVFALATLVVGLALMVLSRKGSHSGLVVLGIVLAVITGLTALAPVEGFQGGVGDRRVEVTRASDIASSYEVAMGTLTIDLSGIEDQGHLGTLTARVGMGEMVIQVPEGMGVEVRAQVAAGEVDLFGEKVGGVGVEETQRSPGFDEAEQQLVIDAEVFMGRVEVRER
ncbi:MAG: LiaF domain-containing protein [Acidimicrobiia bacterium]